MSQAVPELEFDMAEIVNNLVTEDDEPVDNILSEKLQRLLTIILYAAWPPPPDEDAPLAPRRFWAAANVGIYYTARYPLVPDVFISLDAAPPANFTEKKGRCYFVWDQGKAPDVVVEIVSHKKGGELTTKLREYATMGATYYVVFDPLQLLSEDMIRVYEPGLPRRYRLRDDYELPLVGLSLTLWDGSFEGLDYPHWLRWCDAEGRLLPTPDELTAQARQAAAQEAARAA